MFLNHDLIVEKNINLEEIQRKCAQFFLKYKWVKNTYTSTQLNENEYQNSFHIDGVAGLVSNNPDISVKVTRDTIGIKVYIC